MSLYQHFLDSYVRKYSFGNASPDDLWAEMTSANQITDEMWENMVNGRIRRIRDGQVMEIPLTGHWREALERLWHSANVTETTRR